MRACVCARVRGGDGDGDGDGVFVCSPAPHLHTRRGHTRHNKKETKRNAHSAAPACTHLVVHACVLDIYVVVVVCVCGSLSYSGLWGHCVLCVCMCVCVWM